MAFLVRSIRGRVFPYNRVAKAREDYNKYVALDAFYTQLVRHNERIIEKKLKECKYNEVLKHIIKKFPRVLFPYFYETDKSTKNVTTKHLPKEIEKYQSVIQKTETLLKKGPKEINQKDENEVKKEFLSLGIKDKRISNKPISEYLQYLGNKIKEFECHNLLCETKYTREKTSKIPDLNTHDLYRGAWDEALSNVSSHLSNQQNDSVLKEEIKKEWMSVKEEKLLEFCILYRIAKKLDSKRYKINVRDNKFQEMQKETQKEYDKTLIEEYNKFFRRIICDNKLDDYIDDVSKLKEKLESGKWNMNIRRNFTYSHVLHNPQPFSMDILDKSSNKVKINPIARYGSRFLLSIWTTGEKIEIAFDNRFKTELKAAKSKKKSTPGVVKKEHFNSTSTINHHKKEIDVAFSDIRIHTNRNNIPHHIKNKIDINGFDIIQYDTFKEMYEKIDFRNNCLNATITFTYGYGPRSKKESSKSECSYMGIDWGQDRIAYAIGFKTVDDIKEKYGVINICEVNKVNKVNKFKNELDKAYKGRQEFKSSFTNDEKQIFLKKMEKLYFHLKKEYAENRCSDGISGAREQVLVDYIRWIKSYRGFCGYSGCNKYLKTLEEKLLNFRANKRRWVVSKIIELASKNNVIVICRENLDFRVSKFNSKRYNQSISSWSTKSQWELMKEYADIHKIMLRDVNPVLTSRINSSLGKAGIRYIIIDSKIKKDKLGNYIFFDDGHSEEDADINAAKNILGLGLAGIFDLGKDIYYIKPTNTKNIFCTTNKKMSFKKEHNHYIKLKRNAKNIIPSGQSFGIFKTPENNYIEYKEAHKAAEKRFEEWQKRA